MNTLIFLFLTSITAQGRTELIIKKTIRKTAVSMVVIVFLMIAAGVIYIYVIDRTPPAAIKNSKPVALPVQSLPKPQQPSPNAAEGVSVEALTSPVAVGANASATIGTNANSKCDIVVTYANGLISKDSGLAQKASDAYGNVTWTWTVEPNAAVGTGGIRATCVYTNGKSGMVEGSFQVTKG